MKCVTNPYFSLIGIYEYDYHKMGVGGGNKCLSLIQRSDVELGENSSSQTTTNINDPLPSEWRAIYWTPDRGLKVRRWRLLYRQINLIVYA